MKELTRSQVELLQEELELARRVVENDESTSGDDMQRPEMMRAYWIGRADAIERVNNLIGFQDEKG